MGKEIERSDIIYLCDPVKNTRCKKTGCYINGGKCKHTLAFIFSKTGKDPFRNPESFNVGAFGFVEKENK